VVALTVAGLASIIYYREETLCSKIMIPNSSKDKKGKCSPGSWERETGGPYVYMGDWTKGFLRSHMENLKPVCGIDVCMFWIKKAGRAVNQHASL